MNFFTIRGPSDPVDIFFMILVNLGIFCLVVLLAGAVLGWYGYRKKVDMHTRLLHEILEELKRKREEV